MKKLLAVSLVSALFAGQALAAEQTYQIDPSHTFPSFSYNHLGFSTQQLRLDNTSGTIVYDKEARTAAVDIHLDMKAINTGFKEFDEHIQAPEMFDTAKFPVATFKSTKVNFEGDAPKTIEGDLTIKGITKPIVLEVTHFQNTTHPMFEKDAIGANATTKILRSDFDAGHFVPAVGDEVTINIALEAIAE
ncbi:MAG: YceI family protein [Alcaligenaceae bacterium]|nr:YceI family protein [Alcaligenaceae bacterium]